MLKIGLCIQCNASCMVQAKGAGSDELAITVK